MRGIEKGKSVLQKLAGFLFRKAPQRSTGTKLDLSWVDTFIANVRPYIFVREADHLLIKRPNQAQKLNLQGTRLLKALLDGQSIQQLLDEIGDEPRKRHDIALFLYEVRRYLDGKLDEANATSAVEVEPFTSPFSPWPILSEIALTYRCNLKCQFCYAGCNCTTNPVGSPHEMSVPEIKTVLRKIMQQAQVPSVSFTGGEPTLHPSLPELVQYAKELGMWVNLITNGTRITRRLAQQLAEAGLDSAQVSLEGVTSATHEHITAVRGSFTRTVAAVKHLQTVGIHTHTNTTLNRINLQECHAMPAFVRDVLGNNKFSMNLVIPTGSAALNDGLVVRYRELATHLQAILLESQRQGVEFLWYSPTPMCMFNPIVHGLGNKGCSACDGLLSVGANGDVLPCASYDDSVGNLLNEDFTSLWHSPAARQYRQKALAHPQCRQCEYFALCNGACPLYWRHLGFDELCAHKGFVPAAAAHASTPASTLYHHPSFHKG